MFKSWIQSAKSAKMQAGTAFVRPFLSSWTPNGIANKSRNGILGSRLQNRTICWPKRIYVSGTSAISSVLSRQLLIRHRNTSQPDGEETTEEHKETVKVLKRTGMNTPMVLSEKMQQFVGHDMLTRSKVITLVAKYIKENNLYVEGNKRRFVMDQFLSGVLGVVGEHPMLALQKLVSKHLINPKEMGPEYEERSNRMFEEYLKEKGALDSKLVPRPMDPRGLNSLKTQKKLREQGLGMYADVALDPCLRTICGGRDRMSRPQVLKAVWDYIKSKNLQDPKNRRNIIVDDGLRNALRITDAATIDCFHVGRYLWKLCKDPPAK